MEVIGPLLIIALLILVNAIFVAAEIALVTVRRTRVEQLVDEGNRGARRVSRLISHPGRFLAVIQLGITFVGFLTAAFTNQAFNFDERLRGIPALAPYAELIALVSLTAVISIVSIIFGELVPKTFALGHAERVALVLAGPVDLLGRLLRPIVWFLNAVTSAVNRVLGAEGQSPDAISPEELRILVERGGEQGILEAEEEQMISAVMELGERRVHEVMVPRVDVIGVPFDASLDELLDTIVQAGHSRIPVYEGSIDQILGVIYAKDLLPYLKGPDTPPDIKSLMRTPVFVPESMTVDDLLHELQRRKVHIAVVFDEYGGTAGIVTIEDLLEEIVGEIQDEYDTAEQPMVEKLSEDEARLDGRVSVDDLAELFDVQLDGADREEYDTVGGLIYHQLGGVPHVGDTVEIDGLALTVESTEGRRVGKVRAIRRKAEEQPQEIESAS